MIVNLAEEIKRLITRTQPGDSLRTEDDASNSWKRLRCSQGHARDDDDDYYVFLRFVL